MIQCLECGKYLDVITTSHCQARHGISLIRYKMNHPGAPIRSEEYLERLSRGQEERYNPGAYSRRRQEKEVEAFMGQPRERPLEEAQDA